MQYSTPSVVALAAKKVYRHRLILSSPHEERSMQYGSAIAAVNGVLRELTADGIVEAVINSIACPL